MKSEIQNRHFLRREMAWEALGVWDRLIARAFRKLFHNSRLLGGNPDLSPLRQCRVEATRIKVRAPVAFLIALLLVAAQAAWAQRASSWRVFKIVDGLPEPACTSVSIAAAGQVLVTHPNSNSVSVLDGYSVKTVPKTEAWSGRVEQSAGGQFWTVTTNGLLEFRNGEWVPHRVKEIAADLQTRSRDETRSIPLFPVRQSRVLVLLRDRLMEFNAEDPDHPRVEVMLSGEQTKLGAFSSLSGVRDGGLWVGGEYGLARVTGSVRNLSAKSQWTEFGLPPGLKIKNVRAPELDPSGGVTAIGETIDGRQHAVLRVETNSWRVLTLRDEKILRAWQAPDRSYWAAMGDRLVRFEDGDARSVQTNDLPARQIFDVAVEPDGVFWLATSDGLFRHAAPLWRAPTVIASPEAPVEALAEGGPGEIWFVSGGALRRIAGEAQATHALPDGISAVRNLFPLPGGALILDTGDRLIRFDPAEGRFVTLSAPEANGRLRPLGLLKDGTLCLKRIGLGAPDARLEIHDGKTFQSFPGPQPDAEWCDGIGLLFTARNGDLWFVGEKGVARFSNQSWQLFPLSDKNIPAAVLAFAELADGRMVAATDDKLWEFDGRNWSSNRAGFIGIKALLHSRDGTLWVASSEGLHRLMSGTWIENSLPEGLPRTEVSHLREDERGRIWAGTVGGLALFHPEADTDAPQTAIEGLDEARAGVPEGRTLSLKLRAVDRWKSLRGERLLFSHRLDEKEWTAFSESTAVTFSDLPPGKHYFQARAMDRNGNIDPSPARLEFAVMVPWYKEARLIVIAFTGMAAALFFAAVAFNRHRLLRRSYADVERQVAERTRELELAHRELLHGQKMNALGTIAAGIAHDFNNILSIIKGSTQLIEENVDQPQKIQTRVDRIKTVVQQGAGIVEAMLGFSRSSDERSVPCDLNVVVDDTLKLLGERFGREVEVEFERGEKLAEVVVPRDLVQQVLLNFIFNAAESMYAHKRIVIATREISSLPPGMVLAPAASRNYVMVAVKDSGCGISPENLPRVFEPFFTTKAFSTRRGTGLGLSMVYELAKKLGAGLVVESTVGKGSTFTLVLPVGTVPKGSGPIPRNSPATVPSR